MSLAKKLKTNPRELANKIVKEIHLSDVAQDVSVAGPGFINIKLSSEFLKQSLVEMWQHENFGIDKVKNPKHFVIDFSGPNLAKEMHIGHLRTTITGEVISRVIEFLGHQTTRANHVGDWGTQFGMLIEFIFQNHKEVLQNPDSFQVKDLEVFYKNAKKAFDESDQFKTNARKRVVELQSGEETTRKLWQAFLKESLKHCHQVYDLLDVRLEDKGESFYNEMLPEMVAELQNSGIAQKDDGAVVIFIEGYQNRDGKPLPMIIQKSDGGFNYDTTDMAAIKYRIQKLEADHLIYITDIRQAQHFDMVFKAVKKTDWLKKEVAFEHLGYGMILGKDKKPFKTRDGGVVKLIDVINESYDRALKIISQNQKENGRQYEFTSQEEVAKAVGLSAIKYFDLAHSLQSDYIFDWDTMLSFEGNTGPYMLYSYARIQSIFRNAGMKSEDLQVPKNLVLEHELEKNLILNVLKFKGMILQLAKDFKPNLLTDYLYQLSKSFNAFYDKNSGLSVLNADSEDLKLSRLFLIGNVAKILKKGLHLLSLDVVEEM